ncbi:MAG: acyl--CoA ligase, partial [Microbacteriaceae bacterium]|nr:acyl--CoA ligase [Microbacteriaceae bacterium]
LSTALAHRIVQSGVARVGWLAPSSAAFPVMIFAAAKAGVPFVPLNYRLADPMLLDQIDRLERCLLVVDGDNAARVASSAQATLIDRDSLIEQVLNEASDEGALAGEESAEAAYWLFTSGTTGPPKISLLGHDHLSSYILSTVELCSAEEDEAILVSVPPYHIAGLATVLSSFFAGRRMVYLANFTAIDWVTLAREQGVTQAMVVPTMLQRILDECTEPDTLPRLRSLSYGGGRMPKDVIEQALVQLPHVDFANAYGLTETSSTITLLGPDDIRAAFSSDDPVVAKRITSVGKPVPGIELRLVKADGADAELGETGEIWVRGPQVSGRYLGQPGRGEDDWFATRDEGELDADGYLYLHGRMDDVIVRGGENISPGEIEDVLREHAAVADIAVVAQPDSEWGEVPVAVLVLGDAEVSDEELAAFVRSRLRSSRVPDRFVRVDELPYNDMGKVLRTNIRELLAADLGS